MRKAKIDLTYAQSLNERRVSFNAMSVYRMAEMVHISCRHLKWIIFVRPFGQLSPCSGIRISVYSYHLDTHPLSVQILPEFEIIKYSKNKIQNLKAGRPGQILGQIGRESNDKFDFALGH